VDGKVVFIESAVPGDVVDVKLFKNKKDWAEGYPVPVSRIFKRTGRAVLLPFWSLRRVSVANAAL
jgi:23S rRNA (uracil1939-C5)-methyltransferase